MRGCIHCHWQDGDESGRFLEHGGRLQRGWMNFPHRFVVLMLEAAYERVLGKSETEGTRERREALEKHETTTRHSRKRG